MRDHAFHILVLCAAFAFGYFGSAGFGVAVDWLSQRLNARLAVRLLIVAACAAAIASIVVRALAPAPAVSSHAAQSRGGAAGQQSQLQTLGGTV